MSRKIYNRLSFMAVSWLDESTLGSPPLTVIPSRLGGTLPVDCSLCRKTITLLPGAYGLACSSLIFLQVNSESTD